MNNNIQQWEYHRLYLNTNEDVLEALKQVGARGWELVGMHIAAQSLYSVWFYFKRPKLNTNGEDSNRL